MIVLTKFHCNDIDTCTCMSVLGYHETEVSCGGEADLQQHYIGCTKNPVHKQFIPVHDFKIEYLPTGYQDKDLFYWIGAEAALTCRLSVRYTSEHRPEVFPGCQDPYPFFQDRGKNWMRMGTGWVFGVNKYTRKDKKDCECDDCCKPGAHTPKKVWGEVVIGTACHVVFNSEEARHTTCHFSYNSSTLDVSQCPALTGLKVVFSDIEGDVCKMTCVTHDMDFIEKLAQMCDCRLELFEELRSKHWSDPKKVVLGPGVSFVTDPTPGPVIVISHPHGRSKQISIGEWTHRQVLGGTKKHTKISGSKAEYIDSSYKYNAPTCRGSSGAPVIRLMEKGRVEWWWLLYAHPHSGGDGQNNNFSGKMEEFVSFPHTISDQWSKSAIIVAALSILLTLSVPLPAMIASLTDGWDSIRWIVSRIALVFFLCKWFMQCYRDHGPLPDFVAVILLAGSSVVIALILKWVIGPLFSLEEIAAEISREAIWVIIFGAMLKINLGLSVEIFWGWGVGAEIMQGIMEFSGKAVREAVWVGVFGVIWGYLAGFRLDLVLEVDVGWGAVVSIGKTVSLFLILIAYFTIISRTVFYPLLSFRIQHRLRQLTVGTRTSKLQQHIVSWSTRPVKGMCG